MYKHTKYAVHAHDEYSPARAHTWRPGSLYTGKEQLTMLMQRGVAGVLSAAVFDVTLMPVDVCIVAAGQLEMHYCFFKQVVTGPKTS